MDPFLDLTAGSHIAAFPSAGPVLGALDSTRRAADPGCHRVVLDRCQEPVASGRSSPGLRAPRDMCVTNCFAAYCNMQ